METPFKQTTTKKPYTVKNLYGWQNVTIPAGSTVTNETAMGNDDKYHFWVGWAKQVQELTGSNNSILAHDLTYYGLNIPVEYCNDWNHKPTPQATE